MLGTITNRGAKSGFKKIEFEGDWVKTSSHKLTILDKEYEISEGETKVFSFLESDIVHEGMCYIILNNCFITEESYDTPYVISYMNREHMRRFKERYSHGSLFTDLNKFETLDVIDIDNIPDINSDLDLNSFYCYSITSRKLEVVGKGIGTRSGAKCLYLLVPNVWHRLRINGTRRLDIQTVNGKPPSNLLFLRFTPTPIVGI